MEKEGSAAGGVLKKHLPPRPQGLIIGKIASSLYCVNKDIKIKDLADDLLRNEDVYVAGVVDEAGSALGILVRRDLFDLLGKPFGRDLYTKKNVETAMKQARAFEYTMNIFFIAEVIADELYAGQLNYYLLNSPDGGFEGIFSTRDMLVFLSQMTGKDIELARRLQQSMVREELVETRERFIALGASRMAKGVGGDYYLIRKIDGESWLLALCDVAGKGIAASLVTAIVGGMLSIYDFSRGLKDFLIRLNDYIERTFEGERFITAAFIIFNEESGELVLYNLGHSYLYVHRDGRLVWMNTRDDNIPLGVQSGLNPKGARFKLERGDILLLLTDGVLEQKDPSGEGYGVQRISSLISLFRDRGLRRIKDELFADIHIFRKNQPQHDDMTVLMLEYR